MPREVTYQCVGFRARPRLTFGFRISYTDEETYFGISYLSISCLEKLQTSVLGLGQDLGLLLVLGCEMTNLAYVSRYSFNLIPYRFNVRNRFSAYTTCMVGTEHLSKDNF
ncbi:hypothetical protein F2Q69_00012803 [Brassica cretica]|uniref:Uncharacterized protein n=1 Tax=Brassica cretica TaxID=69181 RepID=A0A8S9QUV4_BRACR|nr:hypothetical protein F2Q69_00012803 [Brassica cretica]